MIKQQKAFHPNFAKNDDQLDVFTRKSQEVNDAYAFLQVVLTKKQRPKTPMNHTKDEIIDTAATYAEQKIKDLAADVGSLMEQNHLDRALKKIMEFSSYFNQYFQHKEPWKKGPGTASCVFLSVNAVRSLAIAIFPFIPESAQKIWQQLALDGNVSELEWNEMSVLGISSGHTLGEASPLFAKVEESDIEKYKKQLNPSEEK